MTERRPNLLFLFSDQHAQRVAGCYGDNVVRTPALDRLANSGVTFDNCYCPSPICVPSRMAALTACHPHRLSCWANDDYLSSDIPTWLHALGAAGYRSRLIGRLHAMGPDQLHGYATREVGDHSPNWAGVSRHSMGVLDKANDPNPESLVACGAGQSAYEVKDRDVTSATIEALQRIAEIPVQARDPFSITVGLMLPHAPYVASNHQVEYYLQHLPEPRMLPPAADQEHPWLNWWRNDRGIAQVHPDKVRLARAAYWGLVSTMDEMIGRILDTLIATGLDQDTLVVYASDHGDHVGERGLWWKHTLFDESTKVPLIMSLPGTIRSGTRNDSVISLLDVSQTMIDALGGKPLPHADGQSFWPLTHDRKRTAPERAFSEYCTDAVPAWTGGMAVQQRMLREGDYKLHYYHGYPPMLFNMKEDPDEQVNLAAFDHYQSIVSAMRDTLLEHWHPELIKAQMNIRRERKDVLGAWASNTQPDNQYLWPLSPAMNRIDGQVAMLKKH